MKYIMSDIKQALIVHIAQKLKMPSIPPQLQKQIIKSYNSIDPKIFEGHKLSRILSIISDVIIGELDLKQPTTEPPIDVHEMLKSIVGSSAQGPEDQYVSTTLRPAEQPVQTTDLEINSFLGINDLPTMQLLFNPESLYVYYYVVLDSDYRLVTESALEPVTQFTWNYTETQNTAVGFCNSVGRIRDVVSFRMFQPRVPYVSSMDTDAKRVSVLVEEFAAQSFIAENGRRFHFLLLPEYDSSTTSIELTTEDFNDGVFKFRKPITTFSSITLSFGNPLDIITFTKPFDRFIIPMEFICYASDK